MNDQQTIDPIEDSVLLDYQQFAQSKLRVNPRECVERALHMSLYFFADTPREYSSRPYDFYIKAAKMADQNDFTALYFPERHFNSFGSLFAKPEIITTLLARETDNIRFRQGTIILPLHDPVDIVEAWATADIISGGRVDLSFGSGWDPLLYVKKPHCFAKRNACLYDLIDQVAYLWWGGKLERIDGAQKRVQFQVFPQPIQKQMNIWVTHANDIERFKQAGRCGYHVLTALFSQPSIKGLEKKIAAYREAREEAGFDPESGQVSILAHAMVGEVSQVMPHIEQPLKNYLATAYDWYQTSGVGMRFGGVNKNQVIEKKFQRYCSELALLGSVEHCLGIVDRLYAAGVTEVVNLIDFGVNEEIVLQCFTALVALNQKIKQKYQTTTRRYGRIKLP